MNWASSASYFYKFLLACFVWLLFVKDCKTMLKTLAWGVGIFPVLAGLSPAICTNRREFRLIQIHKKLFCQEFVLMPQIFAVPLFLVDLVPEVHLCLNSFVSSLNF
jgi:hypothetical protein